MMDRWTFSVSAMACVKRLNGDYVFYQDAKQLEATNKTQAERILELEQCQSMTEVNFEGYVEDSKYEIDELKAHIESMRASVWQFIDSPTSKACRRVAMHAAQHAPYQSLTTIKRDAILEMLGSLSGKDRYFSLDRLKVKYIMDYAIKLENQND